MIAPRWRKVAADVRSARGRLLLLAIAMVLSILAVTGLLTAESILDRELSRSFKDAHPASAILHMDDEVTDEVVAAALATPDIRTAEAAGAIGAKIRARDGEWLPLQLTVVPDFDAMEIDRVARESGTWPPPLHTLLLERSGLGLLDLGAERRIEIELSAGERRRLEVAGTVHDETRPPSTQEMALYGYITPATMRELDVDRKLDRLKIIVARDTPTAKDIEATARTLAASLRDQSQRVRLIEIPPPGEHPHQWQYDTITRLLFGFSLLGLVLESMLLAIVVSGLLAPQVRQIAVMKAIGARTAQVAAMYLTLVGAIALAAVLVGLPVGMIAGRRLAYFVAGVVNISIESYAVASWIIALCAGLGLAIPLVSACAPVLAASRKSVRESLDDHGTTTSAFVARESQRFAGLSPVVLLSIRNALRHRRRFAFTVALLTMAGLVFLVAGNALSVWRNVSASANAQRAYDLQLFVREPLERERLLDLARIDGVERAETFDSLPAYLDKGDGIPVTGAGRNGFGLRFVPANTTTTRPEVSEGRWLDAADTNALVINSAARGSLFPQVRIGDTVALLVKGRSVRMKVVGVIREPLSGSAGYATRNVLDALSDVPGRSTSIRIAVARGFSIDDIARRLEADFARAGAAVTYVAKRATMQRAEREHVFVLIALLGLIVAAMGIVGSAGLTSALGTSVIQRTREIGVMRAIGARAGDIYKSVLTEAVAVCATSWLLSLLLSIPATIAAVSAIRRAAFQALRPEWSLATMFGWLAIALVVAAAASVLPARRAARLNVAVAIARV